MIEQRLNELEDRLARNINMAERLQLDLDRPVRSLRDGYPENTVLLSGIMVETLLKHIWREAGIKGDPGRKEMRHLLNGCKDHLRDRTIYDHIVSIGQTRNRASHDGGIVVDEDALDVLRRLGLVLEWFEANYQALSSDEPEFSPRLAEHVRFAAGLYSVLGFRLEEGVSLSEHTAYQLYSRQRGLRADMVELVISEQIEELGAILGAEKRLLKSVVPKVTRLVAVATGGRPGMSLDLPGDWGDAEVVPFDSLAGRFLDFNAYRRTALQAKDDVFDFIPAKGELLELNRATTSFSITTVDDAEELIADTYFAGEGNLLVIGRPGAGKTSQVRRLFRSALHHGRGRIVFLFDLGGKPPDRTLPEYLGDTVADYFTVPRHLVYPLYAYLSRAGRVFNIFDGLDEACPSGTFEEFMEVFSAIAELLSVESQIIITSRVAFLEDTPYTRQLLAREAVTSEKVSQEVQSAGIDPLALPNFRVLKLSPVLLQDDGGVRSVGTPLDVRMQQLTKLELDTSWSSARTTTELTAAYVALKLDEVKISRVRLIEYFGLAFLKGRQSFTVAELFDHFGPNFFEGALQQGLPALRHLFLCDSTTGLIRFRHRSFQEYLAAKYLTGGFRDHSSVLITEQTRQFFHHLAPVDDVDVSGIVQRGRYLVGSSDSLRVHQIKRAFRISPYPVTVREYREFLDAARAGDVLPYQHPAQPDEIDHEPFYERAPPGYFDDDCFLDHPVITLTFWSAHAYAAWRGMRLPNAVEWEVAARGVDGRTFPWGEEPRVDWANIADYWAGRPLLSYEEWKREIDAGGLMDARTMPVDQFAETNISPFGAVGMTGNVWEWTSTLDLHVGRAVICGGSYDNPIRGARTHSKATYRFGGRSNVVGFRCVEDIRQ